MAFLSNENMTFYSPNIKKDNIINRLAEGFRIIYLTLRNVISLGYSLHIRIKLLEMAGIFLSSCPDWLLDQISPLSDRYCLFACLVKGMLSESCYMHLYSI
jgi:hypothetical protein